MCLAVAGKLVEIDGMRGIVEVMGVRREARLETLEAPRVGDYVLIHAGYAIERVDAEIATEIEDAWESLLAQEGSEA